MLKNQYSFHNNTYVIINIECDIDDKTKKFDQQD